MKLQQQEILTPQEVSFFRENGYLLPGKPLFSEEKFNRLFNIFEEHLKNRGELQPDELDVPHHKDSRLFEFLMADEVLDVVEKIIGPNIGLWSSHFICKEPKTGKNTPWHEDSAYWQGRFNKFDSIVTIWLAIDDANIANGCMGVLPGSHDKGFSEYQEIENNNHKIFNIEIKNKVDEEKIVWFELKKGNYSLHDSRIIHGAHANTSNTRRTGYTMRYFSTDLVLNRTHPNNLQHRIYHCRGENNGNNPLIYL
ncbi:phytanoyl-CoA dioxygenase family protein [Mucilaginibacter frigoritolerans]|nr:phytanoyl-CoA dioxygenase family protein [Mucilaginibacter frigoritolerans]